MTTQNVSSPAPYVTTAAGGELVVALRVDVDLYGAGVVHWPGYGRFCALPGPDLQPLREACREARRRWDGREDELEAMLAAARAELAKKTA